MSACPDADLLAALATLSDPERAAIVDHAAGCESCRGVVFAAIDSVPLRGDASPSELALAKTADSGPPPPPEPSIPAGAGDDPTTIDRYRVERRIGAGAMGVVYAAYDPELDRRVAVKLLRAGGSAERLRREAQVLAKLTHANVVAVYDAGVFGDGTFVAMALVDGENLRTWLHEPRSPTQIIAVIAAAARGVVVAHAAGIIHRDLKPDNIFVGRTGDVLVGDFGLARPSGERAEAASPDMESSDLTQTGAVVGTPVYMAPEQMAGEPTKASDQFSLCVTAWEALYGTRPFDGKTLAELAGEIGRGPPEPPKRGVPAHVHAAIERGLAATPAERHASVAALLAAIERKKRRAPLVLAIGAGAALATAAIVIATRGDGDAGTIALDEAIAHCQPTPPAFPALAGTSPLRGDITKRLDDYLGRWSEVARDLCVANARRELVDPLYEAAKLCLDRRTAAIVTIEQESEPFLRLALVEQLEPADSCRTAPAVTWTKELGKLRHEVDRVALRHRINESVTSHDLDAGSLLTQSESLGDPGTGGELAFVTGAELFMRGRDAGETLLYRATTLADRARDDRTRTRAAALLAEALARAGKSSEAAVQRDLAISALARAGDAISAIAVEHAKGVVARASNDTATELAAFERIVELQRTRLGPKSIALMKALFEFSFELQRHNDPRAKAVTEEAKRLGAQLVPEHLRDVLLGSLDLGGVRAAEAEVAYLRLADPDKLPQALDNLAFAYEQTSDPKRSLDSLLESIERYEKQPAATREKDKYEYALESAATMAHDVAERTTDTAVRARELARAITLLDRVDPQNKQEPTRSLRGRVLLAQERYADALPLLVRGLADAEADPKAHANRIAIRSFALAQALWETGGPRDRDRARALVEQARVRFAEAKAIYERDKSGVGLDLLARRFARFEAWTAAHR